MTTTSGLVRGLRQGDADVFLDVPYAAAPVGPARFAAPTPHPPWSGVREAVERGPNAPQPVRNRFGQLDLGPFFGSGWVQGEDYLTVNAWAPPEAQGTAPVLVFVHGGAFLAGSTHGPVYDGQAFARDGIVLVTVNYRLGVAGFLRLADAPDNRGRLDVLAALAWVQQNASSFGGDPGNVTVAGQSAGAILVTSLLGASDSGGLYRRAIVSSGSGSAAFTPEQADRVTVAVGRALNVEPTAAGLAGTTDQQLVEVLPHLTELDLTTETSRDPLGITPFSLVLDRQPLDRLAQHGAPGTALLIGSNRDEGGLYLAPLGDADPTEQDVRAVAARFDPDPDRVVDAYRTARPSDSAAELQVALLGDAMFCVPTRRYARAHAEHGGPTFVYELAWRPDSLDGRLGACHLMDLPLAFDRTDLPELYGPEGLLGSSPPPPDLAMRVHAMWVSFASSGAPGWAPYRTDAPLVQEIDATWTMQVDPHRAEYDSWTSPGDRSGRS